MRRWRAGTRNPCWSGASGPTSRTSFPRPSGVGGPGSPAATLGAPGRAPPRPSGAAAAPPRPSPPAAGAPCRRSSLARAYRPTGGAAAAGPGRRLGSRRANADRPARRAHWRDGPAPGPPSPSCRPRDGACALSPSCPRRILLRWAAPLLRGRDALAIDDARAGGGRSTRRHPQPLAQELAGARAGGGESAPSPRSSATRARSARRSCTAESRAATPARPPHHATRSCWR
jgi:hypothetical protein